MYGQPAVIVQQQQPRGPSAAQAGFCATLMSICCICCMLDAIFWCVVHSRGEKWGLGCFDWFSEFCCSDIRSSLRGSALREDFTTLKGAARAVDQSERGEFCHEWLWLPIFAMTPKIRRSLRSLPVFPPHTLTLLSFLFEHWIVSSSRSRLFSAFLFNLNFPNRSKLARTWSCRRLRLYSTVPLCSICWNGQSLFDVKLRKLRNKEQRFLRQTITAVSELVQAILEHVHD